MFVSRVFEPHFNAHPKHFEDSTLRVSTIGTRTKLTLGNFEVVIHERWVHGVSKNHSVLTFIEFGKLRANITSCIISA